MDTKLLDQIQRAIFVFLAIGLIWLFFAPKKSYGQCQRSTPFTADFTFQTSGKYLNSSVNFGFFNTRKLSLQAGGKIYDTRVEGKANAQVVNVTPIGTMLLKHRFNGEYSKLVHAVGFTAGNNYQEATYRLYGAPTGNSFATLGAILSYSNTQGFTAGFAIMAIF